MELYKKHRPKAMRMIIGQEQTVNSLTNMLERGTLPHTILFRGPYGCGKTTLGRIIKKELDCHDMDFKEINCSNFRGIDTIRDIERIMNLAATGGKVRIWLLDEVHMLTKEAQNAALKMLEDTPQHVYFLLCTSDPQKLNGGIKSRATDMPIRSLTHGEIEKLIKRTLKREKMELSEKVLDEIVHSADGSARSALVILEKISNLKEDEQIKAIEDKIAEENEAIDLCRALIKRASWGAITKILKNLKQDSEAVRWSVMGYARVVLLKEANHQAYLVLSCFKDNFYDSKQYGLIHACFEAIHGE